MNRSPRPAWYGDASCAELTNTDFVGAPDEGRRSFSVRQARALVVCRGGKLPSDMARRDGTIMVAGSVFEECPVRAQCLAYAQAEAITIGVWGGLTARARRPLGRGRGLPTTAPAPASTPAVSEEDPATILATATAKVTAAVAADIIQTGTRTHPSTSTGANHPSASTPSEQSGGEQSVQTDHLEVA